MCFIDLGDLSTINLSISRYRPIFFTKQNLLRHKYHELCTKVLSIYIIFIHYIQFSFMSDHTSRQHSHQHLFFTNNTHYQCFHVQHSHTNLIYGPKKKHFWSIFRNRTVVTLTKLCDIKSHVYGHTAFPNSKESQVQCVTSIFIP